MKKSVFAVFILAWCACFAAGQSDDLFRRALSERNENRWHEISDRFGKQEVEAWDRMYSSWVWQQIEARIALPDIQRFSDQLSEQAQRLTYGAGAQNNMASNLASWRNYGQGMLQSLYKGWEEAADIVFEQLASSLPESGQDQVADYFTDYKAKVHKELETLFLAGERRFLASQLRTEDSSSNDEKTGKKKIEQLFDDISSASDTSMQSLQEAWSSTFDSGMNQWNTYSNQTLASKIDWSRLTSFSNLEGAYDLNNAMAEFAENRALWFSELQSVIQAGKTALDGRASSLNII